MRFSKLRLTGFKSFVDPTELVISDGITGIVGPNGCGKSNLLEALRWVMGENRPTVMRGDGMEDVIFAGASSRPARNFAEVILELDNTERLAPVGFNDFDNLEVVRRITRDVGSAYKVSGKEVRARDIQMLFADASTGSHSPSLVRQGQIAELINAKPKSRRRILEEAAGISGLYQRRHEAELKLNSAEGNLTRVDDMIEQLSSQLAQLARQARQAARYREISQELRATESVLLYFRWKEANETQKDSEKELQKRLIAASKAEFEVQQAFKARQVAEDSMPKLREEETSSQAILQRLRVEKHNLKEQQLQAIDRIETLSNQTLQLVKDLEREQELIGDAKETIHRLQGENKNISSAMEGHEKEVELAADKAREAAAILQSKENELTKITEDVARLAAKHHSASRFLEDSKVMKKKNQDGSKKAQHLADEALLEYERAKNRLQKAVAIEKEWKEKSQLIDLTLIEAEAARSEAQAKEAELSAKKSEAEGEESALKAEVSALKRLVDREKLNKDHVIDHLKVGRGYERALGAALGDDLKIAEVEALSANSGWVNWSFDAEMPDLPTGCEPLSRFVTGVEALYPRLSQIGVLNSEKDHIVQKSLKPGQRLVNRDGDLWRWDGYRVYAKDSSSSAALRLEQINRLSDLQEELGKVSEKLILAKDEHKETLKVFGQASEADRKARENRRNTDQNLAEASRNLSRCEAEVNILESRVENFSLVVERQEEETLLALEKLEEAKKVLSSLDDLEEARIEIGELKKTVDSARGTMMVKRSTHDELLRKAQIRAKRIGEIEEDIINWSKRLETAESRNRDLDVRKRDSEQALEEAKNLPSEIAEKHKKIDASMPEVENRCKLASDLVAKSENLLREKIQLEREKERQASDAREIRARLEERVEAAKESQLIAAQRIKEELNKTPSELMESIDLNLDVTLDLDETEKQVVRLKRQRDSMGAVNLRAEEDTKEIQEQHTKFFEEKSDLEKAIKTLREGISNLNKEGRERLLTAFEQVNTNFAMLFRHLFNGGDASLVMVESDDPLEAGLEIMCQPPGKKLNTLSLLSGGEQTLTALALIFAVFLANPAPICVLDEVDAPLDDSNVIRFCELLEEMCRRTNTRFLIITHHALTMSKMDRLFGVTMQEQGVSQLVSVDLNKAERLVA